MYNYDPAHPGQPITSPLQAQPALINPSQLNQQLYVRIFSESDDSSLYEIDDEDYLPLPICMARFGPADWRVPYVFWFGGVARSGLHIDVYDVGHQLILAGQLPALVQRGRCAETKLHEIWHDGQTGQCGRRRVIQAEAPLLCQR